MRWYDAMVMVVMVMVLVGGEDGDGDSDGDGNRFHSVPYLRTPRPWLKHTVHIRNACVDGIYCMYVNGRERHAGQPAVTPYYYYYYYYYYYFFFLSSPSLRISSWTFFSVSACTTMRMIYDPSAVTTVPGTLSFHDDDNAYQTTPKQVQRLQ